MVAWSLEVLVHTDNWTLEGGQSSEPQASPTMNWFLSMAKMILQEEANPSVVKEPLATIAYLHHPSKWVQYLL